MVAVSEKPETLRSARGLRSGVHAKATLDLIMAGALPKAMSSRWRDRGHFGGEADGGSDSSLSSAAHYIGQSRVFT